MRSVGTVMTAVATAIICMWASAMFAAEKAGSSKEIVRPAEQMEFKEAIPGVSKAVLWGNPTKGKYATLTKFAKGTKNALHTHPHDIRIVVISGTFVYNSGGGEKKLGPGSFLFQPAGVKHTSGAGDGTDCLFFEESDGAFDIKMVK